MAYALDRNAHGIPGDRIYDELVQMGVGSSEAGRIVDTLNDSRRRSSRRSSGVGEGVSGGLGHLVFGILLVLIGGGITIATFAMAKPGGTFVVATGPIVWGLVHFFIGLFKMATGD